VGGTFGPWAGFGKGEKRPYPPFGLIRVLEKVAREREKLHLQAKKDIHTGRKCRMFLEKEEGGL